MVPGPSKAVGHEKLIAEMVWSLPGQCAPRETCERIWTSRVKCSNLHDLAGAFWIWFLNVPTQDLHPWSHSLHEKAAPVPGTEQDKEGWFHAATIFSWLHIPNWSSQTEFAAQPSTSHQTGNCQSCSQAYSWQKMHKPGIKQLLHAWANWEDARYIFRHCLCSKF